MCGFEVVLCFYCYIWGKWGRIVLNCIEGLTISMNNDEYDEVPWYYDRDNEKRARQAPITEKKAFKYGSMLCTLEDIAGLEDYNVNYFVGRINEFPRVIAAWKRGKAEAKTSLRRKQFSKGMHEGDTSMLIHLGKTYIEEQRPEKAKLNVNVDVNELLTQLRDEASKKTIIDITPHDEKPLIENVSE